MAILLPLLRPSDFAEHKNLERILWVVGGFFWVGWIVSLY
jgi:hypothetical protein